jgi:hypothetical protein
VTLIPHGCPLQALVVALQAAGLAGCRPCRLQALQAAGLAGCRSLGSTNGRGALKNSSRLNFPLPINELNHHQETLEAEFKANPPKKLF